MIAVYVWYDKLKELYFKVIKFLKDVNLIVLGLVNT